MIKLDDKQIAEYLHRSYLSVDGLWFMKMEEKYGFDEALAIDVEVWKILPKIQSRMLKPLVKNENPVEALLECLTTRMHLDGFRFKIGVKDEGGFTLLIDSCPYLNLQAKSNRKNLSEKVGDAICNTVHSAWAAEFDSGLSFKLLQRMCKGASSCTFQFRR